jgi:hypothetical protein
MAAVCTSSLPNPLSQSNQRAIEVGLVAREVTDPAGVRVEVVKEKDLTKILVHLALRVRST